MKCTAGNKSVGSPPPNGPKPWHRPIAPRPIRCCVLFKTRGGDSAAAGIGRIRARVGRTRPADVVPAPRCLSAARSRARLESCVAAAGRRRLRPALAPSTRRTAAALGAPAFARPLPTPPLRRSPARRPLLPRRPLAFTARAAVTAHTARHPRISRTPGIPTATALNLHDTLERVFKTRHIERPREAARLATCSGTCTTSTRPNRDCDREGWGWTLC
eukprot:356123-Chlamydomonas_euryale.AAC.8